MGYKEQNSKAIAQAFATAKRRMDEAILVGLKGLLEAGMQYCLEHHHDGGEGHANLTRHLEMKDGYGWVLLYNGTEVARDIYNGSGSETGNASDALDKVKGQCPQVGWAGVVLAGMHPVNYFKVRAEFGVMRNAIKDLKAEDFQRYFEPI